MNPNQKMMDAQAELHADLKDADRYATIVGIPKHISAKEAWTGHCGMGAMVFG